MRGSGQGVKSANNAQARALGLLLVDDLLRVIQAAAALRLAVERRVSHFGRSRAFASGFAHLLLGDGIADADDHACDIRLLRRVRNYAVARPAISPIRRVRAVISAKGMPTRTMWANSWVAMETALGGSGAWKRIGTTTQFIAT